jgi:hypothetical protein
MLVNDPIERQSRKLERVERLTIKGQAQGTVWSNIAAGTKISKGCFPEVVIT